MIFLLTPDEARRGMCVMRRQPGPAFGRPGCKLDPRIHREKVDSIHNDGLPGQKGVHARPDRNARA
jgi:hypothetical protein